MFTEICALVRAAKDGDTSKAVAYSRLLAANLRTAGKTTDADRILRALGDLPPSENVVALDAPLPYSVLNSKALDSRPSVGTFTLPVEAQAGTPANELPACTRPPEGWSCSRPAGHDGPCAARQVFIPLAQCHADPRLPYKREYGPVALPGQETRYKAVCRDCDCGARPAARLIRGNDGREYGVGSRFHAVGDPNGFYQVTEIGPAGVKYLHVDAIARIQEYDAEQTIKLHNAQSYPFPTNDFECKLRDGVWQMIESESPAST